MASRGNPRGKLHAIEAPKEAWERLGRLLRDRRYDLGYPNRRHFEKARKISYRRLLEIENASRPEPSSWGPETLKDIARIYEVEYKSVIAVLREQADDLTPAAPLSAGPYAAPAAPGLPSAPPSGLLREDADRPYATPVWEALLHLADRGVLDPDGGQLVAAVAELIRLGVLPAGTVPLSEKDAQAWDSTAGAMVRSDRVWLVSDLRRRREAFSARQGADSA